MLTTIVDHNDIRLRPMESDGGKPCSQVNESSRQGAGSLQTKDRTKLGLRRSAPTTETNECGHT